MRAVRLTVYAVLAAPFGWLLALALFSAPGRGSFRLTFDLDGAVHNFGAALASSGGSSFLGAFGASLALSAGCAAAAAMIALPAARMLAGYGPAVGRNLTGAFIATRLVPVTAALSALAHPFGLPALPHGLLTVGFIYLALFLPIACACLASADWPGLDRAQALLALDAPLSRRWRVRIAGRLLGGDLAVAGLLVFLLCWSEFYLAIRHSAPGEVTLAQRFAGYQTINGYQWGPLAAALVLCLLPVVAGLGLVGAALARRTRGTD